MKTGKILFLTLVLSIGFSAPGCDSINCNCPDIDGAFFDIQGLHAEVCCGASNPISWQNYHLQMEFEVEYYGFDIQESPVLEGFSLIPSAYSCSCIFNGINGSEEKLEDIIIISKYDYDSLHLANDTINDLFTFNNYQVEQDLVTFLETDSSFILSEDFYLKLQQGPAQAGPFQVEVILKLDNGESYQLESDEVILN